MRKFSEKRIGANKPSEKFVGRFYVIAGRKEQLSLRTMVDTSMTTADGQYLTDGIGCQESGDTLLNVAILLEDALEKLRDWNFDNEELTQSLVEFYIPGKAKDFFNEKLYIDLLETGEDPRYRFGNRNINSEELSLWESLKDLLEEFHDRIAIRDIQSIDFRKCSKKEINNLSHKKKLLYVTQSKVWEKIPDPENKSGNNLDSLIV